jgi:hypothetical protein
MLEAGGEREIVLEVGGGRLEALNLIPQASPLKQFPSNLQPQTSDKTRRIRSFPNRVTN